MASSILVCRRQTQNDGHIKERVFSSLPRDVSLEDLVSEDNFCYRHLEAMLELAFVREMEHPL